MPSPSVSDSAATASAVTSVAGSSTAAGSVAGSGAGTGAGATSTGTRIDSTEGGPITVIPAPGSRSPQVIVQSPALAPGLPAGGAITQLPLTLPVMTGAWVCWARALLCIPARLRLRVTAAMSCLFMDDPPLPGKARRSRSRLLAASAAVRCRPSPLQRVAGGSGFLARRGGDTSAPPGDSGGPPPLQGPGTSSILSTNDPEG